MPDKNKISRRQFLSDAAAVIGGGAGVIGVLGSFKPTAAEAAPIPKKWDQECDVIVVGSRTDGTFSRHRSVGKGCFRGRAGAGQRSRWLRACRWRHFVS